LFMELAPSGEARLPGSPSILVVVSKYDEEGSCLREIPFKRYQMLVRDQILDLTSLFLDQIGIRFLSTCK